MIDLRSAKLLVIDQEDNVLILRRSETHPWAAFQPDLPGGIVEDGEDAKEGVLRELREETGIVFTSTDLVKPMEVVKETKGEYNIKRDMFIIFMDDTRPNIELSWEHDQYSWVPIQEVVGLEAPIQFVVDDIVAKNLWKRI